MISHVHEGLTGQNFSIQCFPIASAPSSPSLGSYVEKWREEWHYKEIIQGLFKRAIIFSDRDGLMAIPKRDKNETYMTGQTSSFNFLWAGALVHLRARFTSVDLQHTSLEWR